MESWSSPETAERVLVHLAAKADPSGRVVTSGRALAREMHGISYSTALRALARLAGSGALHTVRTGRGGRYPSVYRMQRSPDLELADAYAPTTPVA